MVCLPTLIHFCDRSQNLYYYLLNQNVYTYLIYISDIMSQKDVCNATDIDAESGTGDPISNSGLV